MPGKRAIILVLLVSALALSSCATDPTTTTVTTTTVECEVPEQGTDDGEAPDTQECTTISEETTVSNRPRQCHGILSCSFYVAGEVISLPFRALGAVLDILF